jgi:2-keto-3-deoxy-L-rhamnonate aldolase RhmA
MVEDLAAVEDFDGLLAAREMDGVFLGLVDLTAAMGIDAGPDNASVRSQGSALMKVAQDRDKLTDVHASSPEAAAYWFAQGARLVTVACDADLIGGAFGQLVDGVQAARGHAVGL